MKKNLMNRFAILAVVGSILCSALVVGCGGGADDETTTTNTAGNGASSSTTTKEGDS